MKRAKQIYRSLGITAFIAIDLVSLPSGAAADPLLCEHGRSLRTKIEAMSANRDQYTPEAEEKLKVSCEEVRGIIEGNHRLPSADFKTCGHLLRGAAISCKAAFSGRF